MVMSGLSMRATTAHGTTSLRLWGGMLVAMPTAMPLDPFIKSDGTLVGKTAGSCSEPS